MTDMPTVPDYTSCNNNKKNLPRWQANTCNAESRQNTAGAFEGCCNIRHEGDRGWVFKDQMTASVEWTAQ
jgi:hypothetical protein